MRTGEPELVREITEDALFAAARGNWSARAMRTCSSIGDVRAADARA